MSIPSVKEDEIKELLHVTRTSLITTGLGLFPSLLSIKPSPLHYRLSNTLVNSRRSTAFAFPRGFGKSTFCWELMSAWNVLHRQYRYIMFIGSTSKIAEDMFANVRAQLKGHPLLAAIIGKPLKDTGNKFFYRVDNTNYFLACYGAGQQLRGKRHDSVRPDLVIMDDLETTEQVRSPDQRAHMKEWLYADVLPLDIKARFFYIGTMLHEDCLLANLISNPLKDNSTGENWDVMRFGVQDDVTGEPTWPEKYDEVWIDAERRKYIKNNMLYRFNTEYMNIAVARNDRTFDPGRLRFYNPAQLQAALQGGCDILMTVDPGVRKAQDRDPTVIGVTAMDRDGNVWVLDMIRRHMVHHEILDLIRDAYRQYRPHRLIIEGVQGQGYLLQDLEHGSWPGGEIIPSTEVDPKQIRLGKESRILQLEPWFHQRKLLVPATSEWFLDLQVELTTFPRGKHDDMLDVLAYAKLNHIMPAGDIFDVEGILHQPSSTVF
jgi:predicted phage terminase large subunit-like protein